MLLQDHLKSNKIYVGLFLIRQSLSGGVRRLGSLPSHVGGVKEIGETSETGKENRRQKTEGRGKILDCRLEIADLGIRKLVKFVESVRSRGQKSD